MLLVLFACASPDPAPPADDAATRWSGEVALGADFVVPAGSTLEVAPGTTVTLSEGVSLRIEGELLALGTEEEPITFTGDAGARWGSIVFEDDATDAAFEDVDDYVGGSIVEHAVVEHATRGMEIAGASPYLHAVTFRDNELPTTVDTVGGAALLVRDGATPRIRECAFEGNVANLFAFGGALYVDHADPIVQDSTFTGNVGSYGGAIATDWMAGPIVGSRFEGNESASEGGAVSLVSSVSALLADTVVDNHADADGAGLHVCVDCNPHAVPTLLDLVVTGNVSDNTDPDEGAAGIGAAFLGALASSAVHDNVRDGVPSDFGWFNLTAEAWPDWVSAPVIDDVWWGTTDAAAIDAAIYDGADDDRYGVVALGAVRESDVGAPIPRVVLATRKLVYEDAGDAIPVFLTLYNPGPATSATLRITRDGTPFSGDLAYPGATRDGDAWTVDLPENAVWFGTIDETTYDGSVGDVAWEATLVDGDGGTIGVPSVARYLAEPTQ